MKSRIEKIQDKVSKVVWIGGQDSFHLRDQVNELAGIEIFEIEADSLIAVELLKENEIECLVIVPDDFESQIQLICAGDSSTSSPSIGLYSNPTRTQSSFAVQNVISILQTYRGDLVTKTLALYGLPAQLEQPFIISQASIASAEDMGSFLLGSFLPYILILMALTGAMYPAIDLTAGEKERGTLETLLVSGISRVDIVAGKFLTVFTASIVTASLSVASMAFTGSLVLKYYPEVAGQLQFDLTFGQIGIMILALLPMAAIFSSLLMTLSLFAKSYREAQSYISPLMIIVILPAMASLMPDTEGSWELALIPVVNVSMMMKDGLSGSIDPLVTLITMGTNFLLAAAGLFLVQRMFSKESVLFRI